MFSNFPDIFPTDDFTVLPSPPRDVIGKERTFSVYPERPDGQKTCFPGNNGPFFNGGLPVHTFLSPSKSECLKLHVYRQINSPAGPTFELKPIKIGLLKNMTVNDLFREIQDQSFDWLSKQNLGFLRIWPSSDPQKSLALYVLKNVCITRIDFYLPDNKDTAVDPICIPIFAFGSGSWDYLLHRMHEEIKKLTICAGLATDERRTITDRYGRVFFA